jgi:hypothetical protein
MVHAETNTTLLAPDHHIIAGSEDEEIKYH